MNEYQKPFINLLELPQESLEEAAVAVDRASETSKHWKTTRIKLDSVVVVTLKRWLQAVTSLLQPINFWPLRRERLRLGLWRYAEWFHPRIILTRSQNVILFFRFLLGWIWLHRILILKIIAYTAIFIIFLSAVIWFLLNWNDLLSFIRELISSAFR